jgi:hypothetical protein
MTSFVTFSLSGGTRLLRTQSCPTPSSTVASTQEVAKRLFGTDLQYTCVGALGVFPCVELALNRRALFEYDPVKLTSGKNGVFKSDLSISTDPNLSFYVKVNLAYFKFYDSHYSFQLKPGITTIKACEETLQLIVTDHDRSVRIIRAQDA